jgi:hypothetical protein
MQHIIVCLPNLVLLLRLLHPLSIFIPIPYITHMNYRFQNTVDATTTVTNANTPRQQQNYWYHNDDNNIANHQHHPLPSSSYTRFLQRTNLQQQLHQYRIKNLLPRFHQQAHRTNHYRHAYGKTPNHSVMMKQIRGGSDNSYNNNNNYYDSNNKINDYTSQNDDSTSINSTPSNDNNNDYYNDDSSYPPPSSYYRNDSEYQNGASPSLQDDNREEYWDTTTTSSSILPKESTISVQEQFNSWKLQQMQQQQSSSSASSNSSPYVDSKGQTKLLVSINKTSRAVIFFIYMWRILHLYENVSGGSNSITIATTQSFTPNSLLKLRPTSLLSVPLLLLFMSNMIATITLVISSETNHTTKKRLKAILNMNKFVEVIVIIYTFARLTIIPSPYVTKEIYIGRILHAILFIIQGQAYTRFSWDSESIAPSLNHHHHHQQHTSMTTTTTLPASNTNTPNTAKPITTDSYNSRQYSWDNKKPYNNNQ